jgi:hypothetical protein
MDSGDNGFDRGDLDLVIDGMKMLFGLRDFNTAMGTGLGPGMYLLIGIGMQGSSPALAANAGSPNTFWSSRGGFALLPVF